jgi:antagonist of KipI
MIEVIEPGFTTSVQDRGRPGLERFGVTRGGVADWFSAAVANRLVGNAPQAAVLEYAKVGPSLLFHDEALVAITGAEPNGIRGSDVEPSWEPRHIEARRMIALGKLTPGLRGYLAVRGGIDVPPVLGSRSLSMRGEFGGGFGRPLRQGDALAIGALTHGNPMSRRWPLGHRLPPSGPWEIRVIPGPHADVFLREALPRLTATACIVTPAIDRMGLRLESPGLRLQAQEILTTPVVAGSIQVTPSGQLIVLFVDHPTTGGYPVIATVIQADLPLLAQARPGDTIRFRNVDTDEAARALRRLRDWLDDRRPPDNGTDGRAEGKGGRA